MFLIREERRIIIQTETFWPIIKKKKKNYEKKEPRSSRGQNESPSNSKLAAL